MAHFNTQEALLAHGELWNPSREILDVLGNFSLCTRTICETGHIQWDL